MDYRKYYKTYYGIDFESNMVVHHIDENRKNNDISNLILMPSRLHVKWHKAKSQLDSHFRHFSGIHDALSLTDNACYSMPLKYLQEFINARNELTKWVERKMLLDIEKGGVISGECHYRPSV